MSATDNISGRVIAATVIGMVLPTMAVVSRVVARRLKGVRLFVDDYLIILALVSNLDVPLPEAKDY